MTMATKTELDRKLLATLLRLEYDINADLEKLASDLDKALKAASRADKVTKIKQFDTQSKAIVEAYFRQYEAMVAEYSGAVAAYKGTQALLELKPILAQYADTNTLKRMQDKQKGYSVYYQAEMRKRVVEEWGGYTFTERMKTAKNGTTKVIRAIVENEVKKGTSAKDIAKKIQVYVKPTGNARVAPLDVIRASKARSTRGIPSGSIQSNAIRIARTETAYTYRQAAVDYYKDESFVAGFKWVLSNSHGHVDQCNEWAAKELYKADGSDLPSGHPNCVCDTQVVLKSKSELKKLGLE
jgi:hypothetical protein